LNKAPEKNMISHTSSSSLPNKFEHVQKTVINFWRHENKEGTKLWLCKFMSLCAIRGICFWYYNVLIHVTNLH